VLLFPGEKGGFVQFDTAAYSIERSRYRVSFSGVSYEEHKESLIDAKFFEFGRNLRCVMC